MIRTLAHAIVFLTIHGIICHASLRADEPWQQAKLKNVPQSYGTVSASGDSVTQVGQFTDKSITYQVLEEKDKFVRITDGKNSGWCFKISLERVASPAPDTPADIPSGPEEPDWVKSGTAPPKLTDPYQGINVFLKDTAIAKVGNQVIDDSKIPFPSQVGDVNGDWLWVGRGWVRKSDVRTLQEAFDFYVDEVRNNPKSASAWYARAVCWYEKGELNNAIKDFDEAIRLDPKVATYYTGRGAAKRTLKNYIGSIADHDEAIRLKPKSASAYFNRGIAKYSLKNYTSAITDYDEAIRLDPNYANAYLNRGSAKHDITDYTGAIADYDEAIRLNPKSELYFRNRGFSRLYIADWSAAQRDFEEALRLDPKKEPAMNNLSFLFSTCPDDAIRNPTQAAELATRCLDQNPKNAYGMNARACALAAAGDFTSAIEWQKKALEDNEFRDDEGLVGGKLSADRIAAWESKQLWTIPKPE
jgi:tetratricopeptide (TPR) repeat protein